MFKSISNSWQLVKASARVLQADRELMIFPIISVIGLIIVSAAFLVPMIAANFFDSIIAKDSQIIGLIILFLFYTVQYTVIFFANTALVGAALIRLRGGDPTIQDGLKVASSHFGAILGYALISATVGVILNAIQSRSNTAGKIVSSVAEFAWNIATFLVVPILAIEDVGPIEAIKRSVALLKKTWGEQLAGNVGINAIFILVYIVVVIFGIGGLLLAGVLNAPGAVFVGILITWVIVLMLVSLVRSTVNGIFVAAVYNYAVEGNPGTFFDQNLVKNAFRSKITG